MSAQASELKITIADHATHVSGLLLRPDNAIALLVLGHGAGAGMTHPFMENLAQQLADGGVATLRYNFPYKEHGGKRPDRTATLTATTQAAAEVAAELAGGLPVFAGGKSMGGRMTSMAMAEGSLPEIKGLVFFGFPLHAAGKASKTRADHLAEVHAPMFFLQGTRDRLAEIGLMRTVVSDLGSFATLHVIEDADHTFSMLKRSGRTNADAITELSLETLRWINGILTPTPG